MQRNLLLRLLEQLRQRLVRPRQQPLPQRLPRQPLPSARAQVLLRPTRKPLGAGALALLLLAGSGWAQVPHTAPGRSGAELPPELDGAQIREHLGRQVDLSLQFTAENGYQVPLSSFFHSGRPVLLNLVYYECPMLCSLVLNGQTASLKDLAWTPGDEFEVVTVSINPSETFALAREKKKRYLELYGRPTEGWHFLTDYHDNVKKLADEVGFGYKWDEHQKQYAHQAAIMVLTPEGRVSRYLYGIKFRARDLRLALNEGAQGKLGNTLDKIVFYCFHYDPMAKSYVPMARNIMKLGGVLMMLFLGTMVALWSRRERHRTPAEVV